MVRTLALCLMLLVAILAFAGGALAQVAVDDPSAAQYGGGAATGAATASSQASEEASGLEAHVGGLPFTGIDLIVLAGTALVLSGTGFALHRLSAPRV